MNLKKRLQQAGYRYTRPRQIVTEVLQASPNHLTANEIWEAVQNIDDTIGRMSVYRTLDLLTRVGFIRPAAQGADDSRKGIVYVVMDDGHHHHIICQKCGKVMDFTRCELEKIKTFLEKEHGWVITGHLVEFFGFCESCQDT